MNVHDYPHVWEPDPSGFYSCEGDFDLWHYYCAVDGCEAEEIRATACTCELRRRRGEAERSMMELMDR